MIEHSHDGISTTAGLGLAIALIAFVMILVAGTWFDARLDRLEDKNVVAPTPTLLELLATEVAKP